MTIDEASGGCAPYVLCLVIAIVVGVIGLPAFGAGIPVGIVVAVWGCLDVSRKQQIRGDEFRLAALRLYERMTESQKKEAEEKQRRGYMHIEQGDYRRAISDLRNARELGSADTKTILALAMSYYNVGDYANAIPVLKEYLSTKSDDHAAKEMLARAYIATSTICRYTSDTGSHAVRYDMNADDEERVKLLLEVSIFTASKLRSAIVVHLASVFAATGRQDTVATDILREAMEHEPLNATYVAALADACQRQGRPAEAVACCRQLSPDQHTDAGILAYAAALSAIGDTEADSTPVYELSLATNPEDTDIRLRLCEAYTKAGRLDQAVAAYRTGLSTDPNDIRIRYHLALTHLTGGDTEDAIAELQTILRTDGYESYIPESAAYRLLGRCFVKRGMLDTALKQYLMSDRSAETLDQIYDLGAAFESRGENEKARACWEEIYATDVRFRDVAMRLG